MFCGSKVVTKRKWYNMTIAFVSALFFQVMDEHNIVRKEHGLEFFNIDFKLQDEAAKHARWMARNESLVHSRITYGAENIARANVTPKEILRLWMNSPGHRRNILDKRYTKIGAAVYKSKSGRYYWCVRFK